MVTSTPPPLELALAFTDDGIAIGSYGPIAITVLAEPSTLPRLGQLRRHLTRFRTHWPGGTYSLTVLGPGSIIASVPSDIREESTAIARDFPSLGSTIIVEGSGFGGAAIRAFLSTLFLVARNRSHIHATVAEGASWLTPKVTASTKLHIHWPDLVAAVEYARSQIRRV